jgi:TetR/AcrR family transcriptional repressor of nem operon
VTAPTRHETSRGCLLIVTASQTAFQDPAIASAVRTGMDRIRSGFITEMERGRATGQIPTDSSADVPATHLLLPFEGPLVLARSGATDLMNGVDLSLSALRP